MMPPTLLPCQLGMAALIVGALCLQWVSAQAPVSTWAMAYATVDENTLYVHRGIKTPAPNQAIEVPQFYSLDLTKSGWDTSNPPWTVLTSHDMALSGDLHSMTVSPDGKTLTTWYMRDSKNPNAYLAANYSIADNSWTLVPFSMALEFPQRPATDPTTGTVYIPGGSVNSMIKYNFAQGQIITEPIPPLVKTDFTTLYGYSFVWCQARKSFIFFTSDISIKSSFFEYTPSNSQWRLLPAIGFTPPTRNRSCMESAYNGTKIILFGGMATKGGPPVGNIYILDVTSMTWTEGPGGEGRTLMACSVSGDNFLVWGGKLKKILCSIWTSNIRAKKNAASC
ncbi:MAG: hypothetical protein J3R72DRAFT_130096 [Linnemannia gamsii]|nr:MAG: hypothetical protein J3R72DRAFT_130096 [Linnemannia gamsii]